MKQPNNGGRSPTILGVPTCYPDPVQDSKLGASSRRGSGRIAAPIKCEQLWQYANFDQLSPRDQKESALRGTLLHVQIAYARAKRLEKKPGWYFEETCDEALRRIGGANPGELGQAKLAFEVWKAKYSDELDPMAPLLVEVELGATVRDLFVGQGLTPAEDDPVMDELLTARFDFIDLHKTAGKVFAGDIKSSASRRKDQALPVLREDNKYRTAWQQLLYHSIAKLYFPDLEGFVIESIRQFEPFEVRRDPVDFPASALHEVPHLARQGVEAELTAHAKATLGIAPRKQGFMSGACGSATWSCDFRSLCLAESADIEAVTRQAWFIKK